MRFDRSGHRSQVFVRVCNEKWLTEIAGITGVPKLFTQIPGDAQGLIRWVDLVEAEMQV